MEIKTISGISYASNTYVLLNGAEAAVIDPSAPLSVIEDTVGSSIISYVLLTHGHFDHILTLDSLCNKHRCKVLIHRDDADKIGNAALNASAYFGLDMAVRNPDAFLADGDKVRLGDDEITVLSTPGHTSGSVCYHYGDILICGDTLFSSGYGRYDLPTGDPKVLFNSLKLLAAMQGNPVIYPGHGTSCRLSDALVIKELRKSI